jgi:Rrf2 family protein
MQVTRALEYANRAMVLLANNHGNGPLVVSKIAEMISAPPNFLHHVLNNLARAGLVNCLRGSKRGYQLARPPEEISLLDVFETIEGPLAVTSCTADHDWCTNAPHCLLAGIWFNVQDDMAKRLKAATLDKLLAPDLSETGCPLGVD